MTDRTSTGIDQNTAALLSYIVIWPIPISGIIFYLLEKDNKYIRFHALQSILLGLAWLIASVLIVVINWIVRLLPPLLSGFLNAVLVFAFLVASFVIIVLAMLKAFQGDRYKFPIIGDIAERNV